jgi:RHS repeat-associated protein
MTQPAACANNPYLSPVNFTGKERDSESGNDYLGARYYASTMGRFLSPDPSMLDYADPTNPQSLNLYGYGLNNPLIFIDPSGLSCVHADDGTPGDDGDGKGCAEAGILPTPQPNDNNGNSNPNQYDPNQTENVDVTPPPQGQDQAYDTEVAYDQLWLQAKQLENATPTPQDYLLATAKATAPIPNICSGGVSFSYGKGSVSVTLGPGNAGYGGLQGSASYGKHSIGSTTSQNEGAADYNSLVPVLPSPVNVHYSGNGRIVSANGAGKISIKGRKVGVSGFVNISNFGDPNCQ